MTPIMPPALVTPDEVELYDLRYPNLTSEDLQTIDRKVADLPPPTEDQWRKVALILGVSVATRHQGEAVS